MTVLNCFKSKEIKYMYISASLIKKKIHDKYIISGDTLMGKSSRNTLYR